MHPQQQGHNENNGAYTQIVLKVSRSLDSGRFQLVLNRETMEELRIIPPAQNKSSREKKQAARRLRKLKQDMIRRQEVLRIKKLHEHDKCIREQQVMSTNTFLAASVGQTNQGRTCPMLVDSDSSSNSWSSHHYFCENLWLHRDTDTRIKIEHFNHQCWNQTISSKDIICNYLLFIGNKSCTFIW